MSKKNKPDTRGIVFSTDPSFHFEEAKEKVAETLSPAQQKLHIRLDTKQRAGKAVTLVTGFIGTENDLDDFGKKIKNFCGTGGSVKVGEVLVQGDQREKVLLWLFKNGFNNAKKV